MFACFGKTPRSPKRKPKVKTIQSANNAFQSDRVLFRFLNIDTYELNVQHLQIWVFDKDQLCVHATDNEFKSDYYLGKHLNDVILQEDVMETFKDIHTLALNGIESKRTVMINSKLVYIEGRTLYYNEDINDVYASMLIFIPYKNAAPVSRGGNSGGNGPSSSSYMMSKNRNKMYNDFNLTNFNQTKHSLDTMRPKSPKKRPPVKRTLSDTMVKEATSTFLRHE